MDIDRTSRPHAERALVQRVLGLLTWLTLACAGGGLAWACFEPRSGGATLAFCGFVACLVVRAARWWL
ncbi:MAG: hypothetical protein JSR59_13850 [Proteobacteria bacterium]|nr:hypothetical protein [Pseudomonadota bacterium]